MGDIGGGINNIINAFATTMMFLINDFIIISDMTIFDILLTGDL